jgi:carboxyl-terminal processing protease
MIKKHIKKIESLIFIVALIVSSGFFSGNTFYNSTLSNPIDTLTVIKPGNNYEIENQLITSILTRYHFKEFEINDSLSISIFNRYLESLDNGKNYFLQSDIESFNSEKYNLDDKLFKGDIQFYYDVFNTYIKRLNERMSYVDELLNVEFNYSKDENYEYDRDKSDWAKNQSELDEIWRKRLKNDALTY